MFLGIAREFWVSSGIILLLLLISAFLSGSETAITAASRAHMRRLAQKGTRRARWVSYLLERKEQLITAILLGNNLVNILASVLATSLFLGMFGETGLIYATLIMTAIVVIFAEVLPKTYAILTPDRTALRAAIFLRGLLIIFTPFAVLLQQISRLVLRLAGFHEAQAGNLLPAHEEIRSTIDLHHSEGGVIKRDRDMLGGILDLSGIIVGEIMVHRKNMVMIDAALSPQKIIRRILKSPYTRMPLWRDDPENIIGILHAKDVLRALARTSDINKLDFVALASPPWFVPETTLLADQLHAFRDRKTHFALIVDEYGALMGLVTMEDILEEIVGHIDDEHDTAEYGIKQAENGAIEVDGTVTIRDLNREMGWHLPDDEATTIAGLVIHEARTIPEVGQKFDFFKLRFHITGRAHNQITTIVIHDKT